MENSYTYNHANIAGSVMVCIRGGVKSIYPLLWSGQRYYSLIILVSCATDEWTWYHHHGGLRQWVCTMKVLGSKRIQKQHETITLVSLLWFGPPNNNNDVYSSLTSTFPSCIFPHSCTLQTIHSPVELIG